MNSASSRRTGRLITAAALLPALLFAVSSHATLAAADTTAGGPASIAAPAAQAQAKNPAPKAQTADQIENRITDLRKKLRVTATEEPQWNDLAQVMRDNATQMRDSVAERSAKVKTMNAVDDLRSYEQIADEHADGLKHLVTAFEALYTEMTPAQQKNADRVFGERQRSATPRS